MTDDMTLEFEIFKTGYSDLYSTKLFKEFLLHMDEKLSAAAGSKVVIDFSRCTYSYTHSSVVIDRLIDFLLEQSYSRVLVIKTTDHYVLEDMYFSQIFKGSRYLSKQSNSSNMMKEEIRTCCRENDLVVQFRVYDGNVEDYESQLLQSFQVPE